MIWLLNKKVLSLYYNIKTIIMEYLLIVLVAIAILGYAFRVHQWDMWKTNQWETITSFEAKGKYGNMFDKEEIKVFVKVEHTTNLKNNIIRGRVNYGQGWCDYNLDKMYIEIPEIRVDLVKNGFKFGG